MSIDVDTLIKLHNLKAQYFYYLDTQQWDQLESLFLPEARTTGFVFGDSETGSEFTRLLAEFSDGLQSEHRGTSPEIHQLDLRTVRARWRLADDQVWPVDSRGYGGREVKGLYGIRGFGSYEDEYILTDEGWRISQSHLVRSRVELKIRGGDDVILTDFSGGTPDWLPQSNRPESSEG